MLTTIAAFQDACTRRPEAPFLLWQGVPISFAAMLAAVMAQAAQLQTLGVQPGDRVALFLGNGPAFVAGYLGTHMLGAIVVLVNTQYRETELRHILSDSAAAVCLTDAAHAAELLPLRADLPDLREVVCVEGSSQTAAMQEFSTGSAFPAPNVQLPAPDAVALIGYTSGTTGRSKGAMLTHANLMANSAAVTRAWRWTNADRLLLTLPLFHIHGLGVGLNGALTTGCSIDLRARFDAAEALDALEGGTITMFFGVPTMYVRLLDEARRRMEATGRPLAAGRHVRLFVSGSAALAPQTFAEFEELFGQRILERYGMTETVMNTTNPYEGERRAGTVGMPFPGQEARIVDVQTRQPLPDGHVGEIQVRGPHVFAGYWRNPQASTAAFDSDGWFNTGDLGQRSADGYITISGRARELIITGGYNVYPREIEEVLQTHPLVAEAAVFGLPDAEFGEQIIAVVVPAAEWRTHLPDAGAGQQLQHDLIAWCRARLAGYKKPRRVVLVESLPRNAMGKIQKHILREQVAG